MRDMNALLFPFSDRILGLLSSAPSERAPSRGTLSIFIKFNQLLFFLPVPKGRNPRTSRPEKPESSG